MNLQDELTRRLTEAIRQQVKPPVLIGANWMKACPGGDPCDFQYLGAQKIAKATGRPIELVAGNLLKQVKPEELGLKAELTEDGLINFTRIDRAEKGKGGRTEAEGTERKE
jgi:arginyl-tRNA synthetase